MTSALTLVAAAAAAWTAVGALAPTQLGKDRRRLVRVLATAKSNERAAPPKATGNESRFESLRGFERPVLQR